MSDTRTHELGTGETASAYGRIQISEEVVASIVRIVLGRTRGIETTTGSMAAGLTEMLGKKNTNKGIKIEMKEQAVYVTLFLYVEYGVKIPQLALTLQQQVKEAVDGMTGLTTKEVNIYVQGISFAGAESIEKAAEKEKEKEREDEVLP